MHAWPSRSLFTVVRVHVGFVAVSNQCTRNLRFYMCAWGELEFRVPSPAPETRSGMLLFL